MSTPLIIILSIVLVFLIFLSAFFSAAETAYSSLSAITLTKKAKTKKKSALLITKHYKSFGWTLSTILISNNLVNIASSSLLTYTLTSTLGATPMVTVISIFVMTPLIVIFGEIFPKLLAKKYSYGYLSKVVYTIEALNWVFLPFTFFLRKLNFNSGVTNSETDLKAILNLAKDEGVLEKNEASLATNALDLDAIKTKDIMTLKKDVVTMKKGTTLIAAIKLFKKTGFSRIPVVNGNNKYLGIVIMKDIILQDETTIDNFIIEVAHISKNRIASSALEDVRSSRSHMAFVCKTKTDSNVLGVITLEDIVEELIGEIYDEHDKTLSIKEIGLHNFKASGSTKMAEVSKIVGIKFEDSQNITLKKWLQKRIKRKVREGLKYTYKNSISFKVVANKNNQETIIKIRKK